MTDHLAVLEGMLDRKRRIYFASPEGSTISLHELNALDAAIALMRWQSWQDIATAPEEVPADEAVIVCITYDEPRFAGQRMIGEAYKVDGVWWWAGTHPNDYHTDPIEDMYGLGCVTHWQPLPAPPKDTADEQ